MTTFVRPDLGARHTRQFVVVLRALPRVLARIRVADQALMHAMKSALLAFAFNVTS